LKIDPIEGLESEREMFQVEELSPERLMEEEEDKMAKGR